MDSNDFESSLKDLVWGRISPIPVKERHVDFFLYPQQGTSDQWGGNEACECCCSPHTPGGFCLMKKSVFLNDFESRLGNAGWGWGRMPIWFHEGRAYCSPPLICQSLLGGWLAQEVKWLLLYDEGIKER